MLNDGNPIHRHHSVSVGAAAGVPARGLLTTGRNRHRNRNRSSTRGAGHGSNGSVLARRGNSDTRRRAGAAALRKDARDGSLSGDHDDGLRIAGWQVGVDTRVDDVLSLSVYCGRTFGKMQGV